MKPFICYTAILLLFCFCDPFQSIAQTSYPVPVNLSASNIKSCKATLSWDACPNATSYEVRYKQAGLTQTAAVNIGNITSYVFTGLTSSKKYTLKVAAHYPPNNKKSKYATLKITTSSCSVPENIAAKIINPTSAEISWDGCPSDNFQVRYKTAHAITWKFTSCGSNMKTDISQLLPDSTYTYQVCGCADTAGNWTPSASFKLLKKPNIVMLLMDDARFGSYSCQNGPSFFQSPAIDRICHEGADFENNFVVCSICVPGRASLLTGLYPHHNGATDLESTIDPGIITLPEILSDNGYYTAMVGKYHMSMSPVAGWDYWLASTASGNYFNKQYNINGTNKVLPGHSTDVITDSAVAIINRADTSLFLWVAYNAPHDPLQPQTQFAHSYENDAIPVPGNIQRYTQNYPSYVYQQSKQFYLDEDSVIATTRAYYQCLAGIDSSVRRITKTLEQKGMLDNTLLIVTSDNGRLIGEHGLNNKCFPYEESIRVPIFIRYPAWFSDSTVITNQVALNIDVTPTILEAAGITNTFQLDGVSLRKLANGEITRSDMMYEYIYSNTSFPNMPWMRGVRDLNYKYVKYGCSTVTEEFFDLQNDPLELQNLINKSELQSLIQQYRDRLTQLRNQYGDAATEVTLPCYLQSPIMSKQVITEVVPGNSFSLYPNPAAESITISGNVDDMKTLKARVDVVSLLGQHLFSTEISCVEGHFELTFPLGPDFSAGEYILHVKAGSSAMAQLFEVMR